MQIKAAESFTFHCEDWTHQYRKTMQNSFCQSSRYAKSLIFFLKTWTFPWSFPSLEMILPINGMKLFVASRTEANFSSNQIREIKSFFSFMSLICHRSGLKLSYWHRESSGLDFVEAKSRNSIQSMTSRTRNYREESVIKINDRMIIKMYTFDDHLADKMQKPEKCSKSFHIYLQIVDQKTIKVVKGNVVIYNILHELLVVVCFGETFHWFLISMIYISPLLLMGSSIKVTRFIKVIVTDDTLCKMRLWEI